MAAARVERVGGATTVTLRQQVLRPHQRLDEMVFPGDTEPDTAHMAALIDDEVVAVGTVGRQSSPGAGQETAAPGPSAWRIRGMATADGFRNRGLGRAVLDALLAHVASHGGGLVWCNARVPAVSFYRRAGFETRGDPWEEPHIGPHIVMEAWVDPPGVSAGDRAGS
jgi:ribosomal protein S18 acetylase RimI-like enzyme